jgi:hypothetical protein
LPEPSLLSTDTAIFRTGSCFVAGGLSRFRASQLSLGERCKRPAAGVHQHYRPRAVARRDRGFRPHICIRAIKTNIGDSLDVVIHVERRPGRRFVSEVLEINSYNPEADLFDYGAVFEKEACKP